MSLADCCIVMEDKSTVKVTERSIQVTRQAVCTKNLFMSMQFIHAIEFVANFPLH